MDWLQPVIIVLIFWGSLYFYLKSRQSRQLSYLRRYIFHSSIKQKYPHLTNEQTHLVLRALRDYFWMNNHAKCNMVSMPSQVEDDVAEISRILLYRLNQPIKLSD